MYAMDQTMHFEHRTPEPRSRWESRRTSRRGAAPSPSPDTPTPDIEADPTHEFLD